MKFVSAAGTTHTIGDTGANPPTPSFFDINELYAGGSGAGNVAIPIPTQDAAKGTWTVSTTGSDPYFFVAQ